VNEVISISVVLLLMDKIFYWANRMKRGNPHPPTHAGIQELVQERHKAVIARFIDLKAAMKEGFDRMEKGLDAIQEEIRQCGKHRG
jgi:hypothetical protein